MQIQRPGAETAALENHAITEGRGQRAEVVLGERDANSETNDQRAESRDGCHRRQAGSQARRQRWLSEQGAMRPRLHAHYRFQATRQLIRRAAAIRAGADLAIARDEISVLFIIVVIFAAAVAFLRSTPRLLFRMHQHG